MAYSIEVKYFNSFWLKKVVERGVNTFPGWPGLPWRPTGYPVWPFFDGGSVATSSDYTPWFVEESRIKGGYNNTTVDFGVKAYIAEDQSDQQIRGNSLIYSGVYNSNTGLNNTNVFSVASSITRSTDPVCGSIQKLYAEDSNLVIFQENKVSRALIDKDTIYTAEGGTQTQVSGQVIGQIIPYVGEWGISKNPESFAVYGYRKYFADRNRGVVLRLSRDGMTEISNYGMLDYFRDYLSTISDDWNINIVEKPLAGSPGGVLTQFDVTSDDCDDIDIGATVWIDNVDTVAYITNIVGAGATCTITISSSYDFGGGGSKTNAQFVTYTKSKIVGGWDNYNKGYVLSLQTTPSYASTDSDTYDTVNFDETVLGWTSFFTYKPTFTDSLKGTYYSFFGGELWEHNDQITANSRGSFYGTQSEASITFVFNPSPAVTKNFLTVGYEGTNGWEVDSFISSEQGPDLVNSIYTNVTDSINTVLSYDEGAYTESGVSYHAGFDRKENRYVANLVNTTAAQIGEVVFGASMSGIKGFFATVKLSTDATTQAGGMKELFAVSSNFVTSST